MSYILEALKKAQAERQLGNAPTIHAPPPSYSTPAARGSRNPIIIGVIAGTLVVALGAVFLLRQPATVPALQVASAPARIAEPAPPAAPAVPVPAPEPAPASESAPAAPETVALAAPPKPAAPARPAEAANPEAPPPAKRAPASPPPAAKRAPASPPAEQPEPAPRTALAEAAPETARPVHAAAPAVASAAPAADEGVGPLQSLPESVQREIPKVSFGGYIYSPNPAERLLLVDKMLRREGEEVAPGLVLERLLPKAAIMSYRGYRYRVGY